MNSEVINFKQAVLQNVNMHLAGLLNTSTATCFGSARTNAGFVVFMIVINSILELFEGLHLQVDK